MSKIKTENDLLKRIIVDLHWMARRYADGRRSYVTSLFNEHTKALLALGIKLNPMADETIWAKDGHGRALDGLTEAQATPGTPEARGER